MNIYVSNLNEKVDDEALRALFEEFGEVVSAKVIMDKFSGKSRGFGFVEMKNSNEANNAITQLNNADFFGKNLVVNQARPKSPSNSGGGGGRGNFNRRRDY